MLSLTSHLTIDPSQFSSPDPPIKQFKLAPLDVTDRDVQPTNGWCISIFRGSLLEIESDRLCP